MGKYIIRTHQFWSAAYRVLTPGLLAKIWKKSQRQLYRWGADPDYCEDCRRNPIDLLRITCERLLEAGRPDVAEAALALLAEPLGYEVKKSVIDSDSGSINLELLDVESSLGDFCRDYRDALEDKRLDPKERARLILQTNRLQRQVSELKAALRLEQVD